MNLRSRGNSARINVILINNSSHDVIVQILTILGKLTQVRSATPFQVNFDNDDRRERVQQSKETAPENNGLLSNVAQSGAPQLKSSEELPEVKLLEGLSPG